LVLLDRGEQLESTCELSLASPGYSEILQREIALFLALTQRPHTNLS